MNNKHKNTEFRTLIVVAKVISTLFRPIYYPLLGCFILYTLTPLSRAPLDDILKEFFVLFAFTIALPYVLTQLYRKYKQLKAPDMRKRSNRIVPYLIYIACYIILINLMISTSMPYVHLSLIIVALWIQVVCTLINLKWKVSVHSAAAGAIIGGIMAYSAIFQYNPLWWLSLAILVAGIVGTSRMILRQHNLSQIVVGTLIGVFCGFVGIYWGYFFILLYYLSDSIGAEQALLNVQDISNWMSTTLVLPTL